MLTFKKKQYKVYKMSIFKPPSYSSSCLHCITIFSPNLPKYTLLTLWWIFFQYMLCQLACEYSFFFFKESSCIHSFGTSCLHSIIHYEWSFYLHIRTNRSSSFFQWLQRPYHVCVYRQFLLFYRWPYRLP